MCVCVSTRARSLNCETVGGWRPAIHHTQGDGLRTRQLPVYLILSYLRSDQIRSTRSFCMCMHSCAHACTNICSSTHGTHTHARVHTHTHTHAGVPTVVFDVSGLFYVWAGLALSVALIPVVVVMAALVRKGGCVLCGTSCKSARAHTHTSLRMLHADAACKC